MEWYVVGVGILVLLVVMISIGLPIPFAMAGAALPFLWNVQDLSTSLVSAELMIWGIWVKNFTVLAVPLFVFLGELVGHSQIGPRLYDIMHRGVRFPGSAAYGSVGACAGFGAICGSSMIGALTIGSVALPQMLRLGYSKRLATGVIAAGGTLSVLIPPSLILIYYGLITDVSIGKLFLAGVVPGLILVSLFVATVLLWRILLPGDIPGVDEQAPWLLTDSVVALAPIVIIAVVIMGAIYFGIATPTEAAAVAVVVTLVLAFTIGRMTVRGLIEALKATLRTMGYLGLMISAALLLGFTLTYHRVPHEFVQMFVALDLPPYVVLAMEIAFFLLVGMFLEPASITFIALPTMFPLVAAAGYDLIWFAIIYVITMEIAVLTPPVGLNLYVLQGLAPRQVVVADVVVGSLPFIGAMAILIGLLLAFPQLALWVPNTMS